MGVGSGENAQNLLLGGGYCSESRNWVSSSPVVNYIFLIKLSTHFEYNYSDLTKGELRGKIRIYKQWSQSKTSMNTTTISYDIDSNLEIINYLNSLSQLELNKKFILVPSDGKKSPILIVSTYTDLLSNEELLELAIDTNMPRPWFKLNADRTAAIYKWSNGKYEHAGTRNRNIPSKRQ